MFGPYKIENSILGVSTIPSRKTKSHARKEDLCGKQLILAYVFPPEISLKIRCNKRACIEKLEYGKLGQ